MEPFKHAQRWEFWPPTLFYAPVAVYYCWLALRYRSLSLPSLANPGMPAGGIVGESKFQVLSELSRICPEVLAETHLVPFHCIHQQTAAIEALRVQHEIAYPFVLKPDVGQRGDGFKIIRCAEAVYEWVSRFRQAALLQVYAAEPNEAGVFYYRLPSEPKGRIFAITHKVFPTLSGDGVHTLEELIRLDPRASAISHIYLKRFSNDRLRVLAERESLRLVEAGNHCQGAIFLNGDHLWSPELEDAIDRISCSLSGFFVGRYDLRYTSADELRAGRGFRIIELNGASSEATKIYDPSNTLWQAWFTLFRQWEIIFAIASQNRKTGLKSFPASAIWNNWRDYRRKAALYPVSD